MNLAEAELWENLSQHAEAVFQVLEVYLLAFLNQREDDVHLSTLMNLFADAVIQGGQ